MSQERRQAFRISLRLKVLGLVTGILSLAIGSYVALAVTLIRSDRIAYVYDLSRVMADKLAVQSNATLGGLREQLHVFGELAASSATPQARDALAQRIFESDASLLRLVFLRRDEASARAYTPAGTWAAKERLVPLEVTEQDLRDLDTQNPLSPSRHERGSFLVRNRSLPPSAQILSLLVGERTQDAPSQWIVLADLTHDRLLDIFGASAIYEAYLIDADGRVVAHPRREDVLTGRALTNRKVVEAAIADARTKQGSVEFVTPEGEARLGAHAALAVAGLHAIAEIPRETALAATDRLISFSGKMALAIFLVAFLVSLVFAGRLTTPIRRLRVATDRLAKGDYDFDPRVSSRDEIGGLAHDFKRMAHQLRETQVQLVQSEKMAAIGELGAGITHEVKNPIAAIRGFAELALQFRDDTKEVENSCRMILKATTRTLDIINNFLRFARPSSGERVACDPRAIVQEAVAIVAHKLMMSGIELQTRHDLAPQVWADPRMIEQVVINLLLNAEQATPRHGHITLHTGRDERGWATFSVSDTGSGIAEEHLARIFEPFFTTKGSGGTGLGLAISYRIIKDHGGTIDVESKVGAGSTFLIRLPPAATAPPPPPERSSGAAARS